MDNLVNICNELTEKYGGKFVATKDFNSFNVIASDEDPIKAYKEATEKYKIKEPVIFYIPKKGEVFIYSFN